MSSDNSILILKTPVHKGDGFEYRVIHAQAIENIYWDSEKKCHRSENNPDPKLVLKYFGECEILNEGKAFDKAAALEREIGFVEYGITCIALPKPFEYYRFVVNRKVPVTV